MVTEVIDHLINPSFFCKIMFFVRLIINEGLEVGSQIEYIRRARAAGYAVIVTNTNLNDFESSRILRHHTTHPIRVSILQIY